MAKNGNDNGNGNWKNEHGSWHHIIARSIDGPDVRQNKYRWSKEKHNAYHRLFYNYLPSIVIEIIKSWTDRNGNLIPQKIGSRGMKAWSKLFNGASPEQAIKFISKRFLPVEKKFLSGVLISNNSDKAFALFKTKRG
jgi:hypothetical protein